MDPQSQSFTPFGSTQADVAEFQRKLNEHNNRITQIERRQDEDAHGKSIWGHSSPFPGVLSGTPQQAPQQYPSSDHFRTYDDDTNAMMSSLHLDADEEPRSRALGATSRANSVRFDETANQNHFSSHSGRPSLDYPLKQSSGYSGGLHMNERTPSHKSEGRASSVHSLRSLASASGRASSLNPDGSTGDSSPTENPGIAPGQIILGPHPAIIRCWLEQNFKHEAVHYAAICTGSARSWMDIRLIERLGIQDAIRRPEDEGVRTMTLRLYFPEGTQSPPRSSVRMHDPLSMLPTLELTFCVLERSSPEVESKALQINIGSDVLRALDADLLFSKNKLTIFDNEKKRLTVPLVRPEDAAVFNTLRLTSLAGPAPPLAMPEKPQSHPKEARYLNNDNGEGSSTAYIEAIGPAYELSRPTIYTPSGPSTTASPPPGNAANLANAANNANATNATNAGKYRPPGALAADHSGSEPTKAGALGSDIVEGRPGSRQSPASRSSLSMLNTRPDDAPALPALQPAPLPVGSSSGLWGSWRNRDGAQSSSTTPAAASAGGTMDWSAASKGRESSYTRKETGMKVLKPKTANRTFSGTAAAPIAAGTSSPADVRSTSRFFPEGRGASEDHTETRAVVKENLTPTGSATKVSKANPIGGGSAFKFLGSK